MSIIVRKKGRPTKYTENLHNRVKKYTDSRIKTGDFPTIEGLARELGVSTRSLYGWEIEYPEFLQTMDSLRDAQRDMLQAGGLTGKYNARMAIFLLKAIHRLSDATPLLQATQNNYMNISPDVLAEALKLMEASNT